MKVGDRIRVFEVTYKSNEPSFAGIQAAERMDAFFGNPCGVNLPLDFSDGIIHVGIDEREQAKHVATMVITNLK